MARATVTPPRPRSRSIVRRLSVGCAVALGGVLYFLGAGSSCSRVANRLDSETVEIRFAHYQLEPGLRDALDLLAANYEQLQAAQGKKVRVRQLVIPDKVFPVWVRTQLLGRTAPEIIELSPHKGMTNEIIGKYFVPLGHWVDEPNPYNAGTELEGVAWRETFLDNLEGGDASFNRELAEYFGIPQTTNTHRLILNRDLLEKILAQPENAPLRLELGTALAPRTHEQLIALCQAARRYGEQNQIELVPIASSEFDSRILTARLFSAVTQRLVLELNATRIRRLGNRDFELDIALGRLPLDHPAFLAGFSIIQEIAAFMPPGFLQLKREDSSFLFAQGRALMLCIGAYDFPTFKNLVGDRFPVLICNVPPPDTRGSRYGPFVLGDEAASGSAIAAFGLVNFHGEEKIAVALDFLRYLTSAEGARIFSRESKWVPSVRGVLPDEEIKPFYPDREGYPPGVNHYWQLGGADGRGAFERGLHLLVGHHGDVERFVDHLEARYAPALRANYLKAEAEAVRNLRRQDSLLGLRCFEHSDDGLRAGDPTVEDLARLIEVQTEIETGLLRRSQQLHAKGIRSNY